MTTWSGRPAFNFTDYITAEKFKAILDQMDVVSSPAATLSADHAGVTSSTTFVSTNLKRPAVASQAYHFRCHLYYSASTAGDFKPGLSLPSGSTLHRYALRSLPSGSDTNSGDTYYGTDTTFGTLTAPGQTTASTIIHCVMEGDFTTGVTAGDVTVQYAQAASNATPTILRARSTLHLQPVEVV